MRPRLHLASALLVASGVALAPRLASAIPDYPQKLQDVLGLECPPQCTLCHEDMNGGAGTIRRDKSFGNSATHLQAAPTANLQNYLRQHGITQPKSLNDNSIDRLKEITDWMQGAAAITVPSGAAWPAVDSDGDGMGDIDELKASRDPNTPGEGVLCGPLYGCGAEIAPPPPRDRDGRALAALGAGVTALVLASHLRRRKRR